MSRREQWEQLSQELGFEFKRGARSFLESPAGRREMEARFADGEIPAANIEILDHPIVRSLIELVFEGAATGEYRGFEFSLYPTSQRPSEGSTTPYANVTLLFGKVYDLDLSIYHETFFSRVGKVLLGTQDVQLGNPELDKLIMIKGKNELLVKDLLEAPAVQQALLEMYRMSTQFEIRDYGIFHKEVASVITRDRAIALMDKMVDVAEALQPH